MQELRLAIKGEVNVRVLHLLTSVTGAGCGIVNAAIDIMSGQMQQGIDFAVCAGYGEFTEFLTEHRITFFPLNQKRTVGKLLGALRELRKIILMYRPDIVHCHMMTSLILARIVRLTTPFHIVAHVHNVHQRSSNLMGLADHVIAVSDAVRADMIRRGIPASQISVVHNGTLGSLRLLEANMHPAAELCQPAIVTVGGMNHRKGIRELIEGFEQLAAKIPVCHLYLIGDGPDAPEFKHQASQSRYESRIHFLGFQANPTPFMKAAKLFVLASRRESFGLVLTEARECGCAIVASDVDGIPEALDGGRAGILVPPNNPDALAKGMLAILEDESALRSLKARAQEGLERFSVLRLSDDVTKVYSALRVCN